MRTAYVRMAVVSTGRRSAPVRGEAIGPFVVHRTPPRWRTPDEFWRVTHKKSGLLAAWDRTKAGAIRKARAVIALGRKLGVDWNGIATYEDALAIPAALRDKLKRAAGWSEDWRPA